MDSRRVRRDQVDMAPARYGVILSRNDGLGLGLLGPKRMPIDDAARHTVAERYSSDAEVYEKTWAPVLRPHGQYLLECLPLNQARRVLDAGAGVGTLLGDIQTAAPSATVVAVDCSEGMLARAPAGFPRSVMDVACLGLAPATFDVAVMAFMLFHVRDAGQALREMRRVLRPGGTVGTITWDGEPHFTAQRVFLEELDTHGAAPGDPCFSDHTPVSSPLRMKDMLASAGFDSVHAWTAAFDHPYTMEEFIAIRTSRGQTRQRFESLKPERRASFLLQLRNRLTHMRPSDFLDQATLIYATAIRR